MAHPATQQARDQFGSGAGAQGQQDPYKPAGAGASAAGAGGGGAATYNATGGFGTATTTTATATAPAATKLSDDEILQQALARPGACTDWWRHMIFFLLLISAGLGGFAIGWNKWQEVAGVSTGLIDFTSTNTTACPNGGFNQLQRLIVVFCMVANGIFFAFLGAISFVFPTVLGVCCDVFRHVFTFISMGCWTAGIVMYYMNYLFCDAATTGASYGLSFWFGVGGAGAAAIAWLFDTFSHIALSCCKCCGGPRFSDSEIDAMKKKKAQRDADLAAQEKANAAAQNPVAAAEEAVRQLDYSNANASGGDFTDLNQVERDPAEVGLDPSWYFDVNSGFWWSEEAQLYYDENSAAYGNPTDSTWYVDGRWVKYDDNGNLIE